MKYEETVQSLANKKHKTSFPSKPTYTMDGLKKVLKMYIAENESSKYWLMVLDGL